MIQIVIFFTTALLVINLSLSVPWTPNNQSMDASNSEERGQWDSPCHKCIRALYNTTFPYPVKTTEITIAQMFAIAQDGGTYFKTICGNVTPLTAKFCADLAQALPQVLACACMP